jgi:molecular chaperone HtpG
MNNDILKDLILFYSSYEKKRITLKEYVSRMKDGQDKIYYASGEGVDKIDMLPVVERIKDKDYEILYLTEYVDEFTLQSLGEYETYKFVNVSSEDVDLDTEEEKEEIKKVNEDNKDMLGFMSEILSDVKQVRFTNKLKNHPVCLSTEGKLSLEMEKVLNSMPDAQEVKANVILEINEEHPIADKLKDLYESDKSQLEKYSKVLYNQARLIEGLGVENPTELTNIICDLMSK